MHATAIDQFASDPVAAHSGQFPLGRNAMPADLSSPSPVGTRPWILSGMRFARQQGNSVSEEFAYDHSRQIAVNRVGVPLTVVDATAKKDTNNDGDEGPSEDFTYDYCPDSPAGI